MKINSDFVWAVILVCVAAAAFFLGIEKERLDGEEQLEEKLEEIKILESKNQQLSDELMSRGIYSYPQATVISKMKDSVAVVLISLNGKDPIQDLKLRRNVYFNYSAMAITEPSKEGKLTDLGDLKPHNPSAFDIPLTGREVALQLDFESKRNKWHQYIWIRKSGEGKIKSFWVITNENSLIIDKHIDSGFPTDAEDKMMLWKNKYIKYSDIQMNSTFPPRLDSESSQLETNTKK